MIDGSIVHGRDTRKDKEGDDDDEQIHIQLDLVPSNVTFLCFYLTSCTGSPLEDVETCCARLVDSESLRSIALLDCYDANIKKHASLLVCMLIRVGKRWVFYNGSALCPDTALAEILLHAQSFIPASETVQKILIVSLAKYEEYEFEMTDVQTLNIHSGWTSSDRSAEFALSVVMFDRDGRFVDGVDGRRFNSRRGPRLSHHNHSTSDFGHEEIIIRMDDPKQENISAYYIVVNGRNKASDLRNLPDVGVRVLIGASETAEICRYIEPPTSCSYQGIILLRILRHREESKVCVGICKIAVFD